MSNRLANWVDHTKEKAQQEEAERRNDLLDPHALGDMQPVEARNRRVRGRLKDGIDLQAHYHCEFSKPSARAGGYIRYTTGTASARIARQARVALGKVYSEYGATNSFGK